ncbi:hypothetical protein ANN_18000 [Periplaneta americana]|uniref:Uncharacterized protein n=1 Tax=Periplaneta americana TaxID=6978 RepID=A0ABQ8SMI5_PERAM|nr:hypothetical protein ANN_18000 [Periplaneta americana]
MAGLCEGDNEPAGSLKAICKKVSKSRPPVAQCLDVTMFEWEERKKKRIPSRTFPARASSEDIPLHLQVTRSASHAPDLVSDWTAFHLSPDKINAHEFHVKGKTPVAQQNPGQLQISESFSRAPYPDDSVYFPRRGLGFRSRKGSATNRSQGIAVDHASNPPVPEVAEHLYKLPSIGFQHLCKPRGSGAPADVQNKTPAADSHE